MASDICGEVARAGVSAHAKRDVVECSDERAEGDVRCKRGVLRMVKPKRMKWMLETRLTSSTETTTRPVSLTFSYPIVQSTAEPTPSRASAMSRT